MCSLLTVLFIILMNFITTLEQAFGSTHHALVPETQLLHVKVILQLKYGVWSIEAQILNLLHLYPVTGW